MFRKETCLGADALYASKSRVFGEEVGVAWGSVTLLFESCSI
jgi:hypothetical protein